MAVRLFSAGVDLFAPPQTVCYHLWKRNSLRIRVDNDPDREKQKAMSLDVVRRQLKGLGNGIGSVRSVEQFSRELGVDFENQSLAAGCEDAGLPATSFVSSLFSGCKIEDTVKNCIREPANDDLRSVLSLVSRFVREI